MLHVAREAWSMLCEAGSDWIEDKAPQLGAALAFYSILSIAPLLIVALAIAALAFGEDAAREQMLRQIQGLAGSEGAAAVRQMLSHARRPEEGSIAAALGIATLLVGATGVFAQLREAMNAIWHAETPRRGGVWPHLMSRLLSFAMVLGVGFLLLVSLTLSALISGLSNYLGSLIPDAASFWHGADAAFSFAIVALLFAMIFKFLPDAHVEWRHVWVGALLTAALFIVGKMLIGLYLGRTGISSAYGTAGSLVVLVVWVYYSSQILFFGAEFTKVYARRQESKSGQPPGSGGAGDNGNAPGRFRSLA